MGITRRGLLGMLAGAAIAPAVSFDPARASALMQVWPVAPIGRRRIWTWDYVRSIEMADPAAYETRSTELAFRVVKQVWRRFGLLPVQSEAPELPKGVFRATHGYCGGLNMRVVTAYDLYADRFIMMVDTLVVPA